MSKNKFRSLFDSNKSSVLLTNIYFENCNKVNAEDLEELREAYFAASDIAESREIDEAAMEDMYN